MDAGNLWFQVCENFFYISERKKERKTDGQTDRQTDNLVNCTALCNKLREPKHKHIKLGLKAGLFTLAVFAKISSAMF
jgi:hypothetical protein